MNEQELKEIERLFYLYKEEPIRENARRLKHFMLFCAKNIDLKRVKK